MTHYVYRLITIIISLILIVPLPTMAQTATPEPWPPDPNLIFSDQVKAIFLDTPTIITATSIPTSHSQSNDKCGEPIEHYASREPWHFYLDPQTGKMRFCENTTGKLTDALPDSIIYWTDNAPSSSPNGQWLAFWGEKLNSDHFVESYILYSYEFKTGKLNQLGEIKYDSFSEDVGVAVWFDNRHGVASQSGGPEISGTALFSFDVEKENSLQFAFSGWPTFNNNPLRYEFLETKQYLEWKTGAMLDSDILCTLSIYDKNGYQVHTLGKACLPLYVSSSLSEAEYDYTTHVGDQYFFKPFDETDPNFSQRISVIDVSTGKINDIFYGDADILSVSPDTKHLILIINHSMFALYNVETEALIYVSEHSDDRRTQGMSYRINWLSNHQVLVYVSAKLNPVKMTSTGEGYSISLPSSLRLIHINTDETTSVKAIYQDIMPEPENIFPKGQYILAGDILYNFANVSSFHILTDEAKMYSITLNWVDDTHIQASVHSKADFSLAQTFTLILDGSS